MSDGQYILLCEIDLGPESDDALEINVVLPTATVNVGYAGAFIASGGVPAYTYDDTPSGSFPPGLVIDDATGLVTGTPSATGYYEFTAAVTDSDTPPVTATKVVSILVVSGIAFVGTFAPGEVGIAYSSGLSASGGVAPYTWSVTSGSEPTGTTINATTGLVEGTPSVAGTFNLTVTATDSNGDAQDFPTSISIALAVDLSTSTFPGGTVGGFYSAGPTTIGGVAPFTYSISSGAIPAGTTFSSSTGFVSGQPTTVATYNFDVTALDVLGGTDTYSATVVISNSGGGGGGSVNSVTGVSPIVVDNTDPDNPIVEHATSGVSAGTYGDATHVAVFHVDSDGHVTSASGQAISFPAKQTQIQFQDEGSNLGATGTVDTVNFVGDAVTASRVSNTVTVSVPAAVSRTLYGAGRDGAVVFDGTAVIPGFTGPTSGAYVQTQFDKFFTDITISGNASINCNASKFWGSGKLTVTTSAAIAITVRGNNGSNAAGTAGAAAGNSGVSAAGSLGNSANGNSGGAGGTAAGVGGGAGLTTQKAMIGGGGGQGGKGGTGSSGSGGNGGAAGNSSTTFFAVNGAADDIYGVNTGGNFVRILGGYGGSGGGGGGGDGTAGGGGGGGGGGGAILQLRFRQIDTTGYAGTLATAQGGNGGNGFTPAAGNRGGGAGGAGGGGGYLILMYESKSGTVTLDASGGRGGNGAAGSGTGTTGAGGAGGAGGFIDVYNTLTGIVTIASGTFQGLTAPVVATGTAGESIQITL